MSVTGDWARPFPAPGCGGAELARFLMRADVGAFVVDADERISLWNPAAEQIMGYAARELIGRRCRDLFVAEDGDGHRLRCQSCPTVAAPSEPVHTFDLQARTKTGTPVWLNVEVLARGVDGTRPATIHLFCDVTELRTFSLRLYEPRRRSDAAAARGATLTKREVEVLRLMTLGASTATAAKQLRVSPVTIRNHVQNIFTKLGVHSRLEAVAYATRHRVLSSHSDTWPSSPAARMDEGRRVKNSRR